MRANNLPLMTREMLEYLLELVTADMSQEEGETPEDITAIAKELEATIRHKATPIVSKPVEITEVDEASQPRYVINLYSVAHRTFESLEAQAPLDRLMVKAKGMIMSCKEEESLAEPDRLWITALQIVYTNLSKDFWGTPKAEADINILLSIHDGSTQ